jgi:hypothetical protein
MMSRLARRIGDEPLLRIARRFLAAGRCSTASAPCYEGTPQGGPLSLLLTNLLLDDLDKELEHRGHRFCRYADDRNICVQALETPPDTGRETEPRKLAEPRGLPDRVVHGRRPQPLSEVEKTHGVTRPLLVVAAAGRDQPALAASQRQQQRAAAALWLLSIVSTAFQSAGAWSGIAKTADAYPISRYQLR